MRVMIGKWYFLIFLRLTCLSPRNRYFHCACYMLVEFLRSSLLIPAHIRRISESMLYIAPSANTRKAHNSERERNCQQLVTSHLKEKINLPQVALLVSFDLIGLAPISNYWLNTSSICWGARLCGDLILSIWKLLYLAGFSWNMLSLRSILTPNPQRIWVKSVEKCMAPLIYRGAKSVETIEVKSIDLFRSKTYKKHIYGKISLGISYLVFPN